MRTRKSHNKIRGNRIGSKFSPALEPLEQRCLLSFTPGNLAILRIGDGSGALTSSATAAFIDEYTTSGVLVQSVPFSTSGASALTMTGTSFTQGNIGRSEDGQYLVVGGFRKDVGLTNPVNDSAAVTNRVIGRVDADENIGATTALNDVPGEIRSVGSVDGSSFYLTSSTGGLRYVPNVGPGTSNDLSNLPSNNLRQVQVIDGNLYISSGAIDPGKTVFQVGTGLPTSGAQDYEALLPIGNSQYNSFFTADLSDSESGFDTIYAVNTLFPTGPTGLQKFSKVNDEWVLNGNTQINWPVDGSDSPFGITGIVQGNTVSLWVTSTSAGSGPSVLQTIVDATGYNQTMTASFSLLADSDINNFKIFKGVQFVPSDAPVLATPSGPANYAENTPAVSVDAALTLTDGDSANLTSATVSITGNFTSGQDVLSFTPSGGISGSYGVDGVLRLYGTATAASYQTVLRSVMYQNTGENPNSSPRTISFRVKDNSVVPSNVATTTVNITPANDAPTVTVPTAQTVGTSHALTLSALNLNAITVADIDGQSGLELLTLSVNTGTLSLATTAGLTGSGNGTASLSYTGTLANLNAALNGLIYNAPGSVQTVTLTVTLNDQGNTGTGGFLSDTELLTINVSNVQNQIPVITTTGGALNYFEGNGNVAIDAGLTATDADDSSFTSASVSISNNYLNGQDVLSFVDANGITGSFNAGTGALTLSGASSVANYQAALRSVTYGNTSDTPNTATRTVTFVVNDGNDPSVPKIRTISVTATNDAPVVTVPGGQSFAKNTSRVFSSGQGNAPSVSDPDANGGNEQISIVSANGTLTLSTLAGLVGSGNGTGALTYTGSLAAINAALDGLTFAPTTNFTGSTQIDFSVDDLGNSPAPPQTGNGSIPITIVDPAGLVINEILFSPPTSIATDQYVEIRSTAGPNYTIPVGTYLVGVEGNENLDTGAIHDIFDLGGMTTGSNSMLVLLEKDHLYSINGLTDPNATLLENTGLEGGFGNNNDIGGGSTIGHSGSFTFTTIERANPVTFFLIQSPTAPLVNDDVDSDDNGFTDGSQFLNWTVLDSIGFGNALTGTTNFNYGAINYINPNGSTTAPQGVTISTGFTPGYFGRSADTTGSTPNDWVAATLQGSSPFWSISQSNTSLPGYAGLPLDHVGATNFAGILHRPVVDLNGVLGGRDGLSSFTQGGGPKVISSEAEVTDVDGGNLTSMTVKIVNQLNGGSEVLAANTAGTSIVASYAGNTLTLNGADSLANYQQVLRTVTYNNTSGSPNLATRSIEVLANDGANVSLVSTSQLGVFSNTYSAVINEIDVDPPGLDAPYEYIELRGTPGSSLNNMYLVSFESQYVFGNPGDPGVGQTGIANFVQSLNGQVFGANGLLVIKASSGGYTPPVDTTIVTSTALDTLGGGLKGGSNSFFLIHKTTPIVLNQDYDLDDNGTLDAALLGGAEIVDSVSWKHHDFDNDLPYGVIQLAQPTSSPDAATRFLADTSHTIGAWYDGALVTSGPDLLKLRYDASDASPNLPPGALLTPGAPNAPNADPMVDLNGGAVGTDFSSTWFNSGAINITSSVAATATDDGANLSSLTATIVGVHAGDVLSATTPGGITSSYNAGAGTLTLTGISSLADYQTALRSIKYNNIAGGPGVGAVTVNILVNDGQFDSLIATATVNISLPAVVGRHLFYNQSGGGATRYDGNNLAISASDDNAIATDKTAYLWENPGAANFSNVSSYTKGINGIMVDISGSHPSISADDFIFRVGNNNSPGTWATANAPTSISVRAGAGVSGSDRVTIIWNGAAAPIKQWLQVIVLANADTGLAQKPGYPVGHGDQFFFGNAVGNTGLGDTVINSTVTVTDEAGIRANPAALATNIPITNIYDVGRNASVTVADESSARLNSTNSTTALKYLNLTTAPAAPEADGGDEVSPLVDDSGVASALTGSALSKLEGGVPKWLTNRVEHLDLNSGSPARLFHYLAEQNNPRSRALLHKFDVVADALGLDDELLDSLIEGLPTR